MLSTRDVTARRAEFFEVALLNPRRGLTDTPRKVSAATIAFETLSGDAAGGPYPCVYDADADGWAALCPPRTEAVGTTLVTVASVTVAGITYVSRGTLTVVA